MPPQKIVKSGQERSRGTAPDATTTLRTSEVQARRIFEQRERGRGRARPEKEPRSLFLDHRANVGGGEAVVFGGGEHVDGGREPDGVVEVDCGSRKHREWQESDLVSSRKGRSTEKCSQPAWMWDVRMAFDVGGEDPDTHGCRRSRGGGLVERDAGHEGGLRASKIARPASGSGCIKQGRVEASVLRQKIAKYIIHKMEPWMGGSGMFEVRRRAEQEVPFK